MLYYSITYAALFAGIIPLIVLFLKKRAFVVSDSIQPFVWLTFIATLYEGIGTFILKVNTTYWFQIYSLLEFLTIYYFFYKLLRSSYKKVFTISFIVLLTTYILSFYFWKEYQSLVANAINKIAITLFVFFFSYIWFKQLFQKMEIPNLLKDSNFYFVSGLAIYYSSTSFLFLLSCFIFENRVYLFDIWLVNIIATLILRTCLIIGVWNMKRV
ncbi:hypothetical protein [Myroides indicus]|uniref:YhhN-like protein n=1 Tax=Myroides indicus TaxID=1323422 RepID=A0A4R7F3U1_9FLAO|nr:hypothetical protein [Myroides indicus]TDS64258.1 hypothetical protein C8P70_105107 [Myroides indicus]